MLHENQIPETEAVMVEFTNYEKYLTIRALKKQKSEIERILSMFDKGINKISGGEKAYWVNEEDLPKLRQEVKDIDMVINRMEKSKWSF